MHRSYRPQDLHAAGKANPLTLAAHGYFWTGIEQVDTSAGRTLRGQTYVEYFIPQDLRHPVPIVMVHGGGGQGLDYLGTADGREGWVYWFVRRGHAVYVIDRPQHGRSPFHPDAQGAMAPFAPPAFPGSIEHQILGDPVQIGAAIADRSRIDGLDSDPQLLDQILSFDVIARASRQKAQEFAAQLSEQLDQTGWRGRDHTLLEPTVAMPDARRSDKIGRGRSCAERCRPDGMRMVDVRAFYAPDGGAVSTYVEHKLKVASAPGYEERSYRGLIALTCPISPRPGKRWLGRRRAARIS